MVIDTKEACKALTERRSGILLHPTSLPGGNDRNGEFSGEAYRFVEFAKAAGFTLWQMLPLGPTHNDGSPYQCLSVHAGNPDLISLDLVRHDGWIPMDSPVHSYDARHDMLRAAKRGFEAVGSKDEQQKFTDFVKKHKHWLEDYAVYCAIRNELNQSPWWDWPEELRDKKATAIKEAKKRLKAEIEQTYFEQFLFFKQWYMLADYAKSHGIYLFGDMPIFVAHDSADVWANRKFFLLDEAGFAPVVAGVPPDYFSETGQKWGNPLYDWKAMKKDGYSWWIERMRTQLEMFDIVRIDHFRGFEAYWEIPQDEPATNGKWVKAPGDELFNAMREALGELPVIAEDLGIVTDEVTALRKAHNFPGMKVLQFAFDGDVDNMYLPHNHEADSVIYTGTHDNDTTMGWYHSAPGHIKHQMMEYFGFPSEQMPWALIRQAFRSHANLAIVPMQDLLELGADCRMNIPGTDQRNWAWRYGWDQVHGDLANRTRHLNWFYRRCL